MTPTLVPTKDFFKTINTYKTKRLVPFSNQSHLASHYRHSSHHSRRFSNQPDPRISNTFTDFPDLNQVIKLRRANIPSLIAKHEKQPLQDLSIFERTIMRSHDSSHCSEKGHRRILDVLVRSDLPEDISPTSDCAMLQRPTTLTPCTKRQRNIDKDIFNFIKTNDTKALRYLLKKNKNAISYQDVTGGTPLHLAVKLNNLQIVELLLAHGADMHALDLLNRSCMDLALERDLLTMYEYLLRESGDGKFKSIKQGQGKKATRRME
jgi:hypothetical protein